MAINKTNAEYAASKYNEYVVKDSCILMEFLLKQKHGTSRNKLKDILKGNGIAVDKKIVTQYDYQLQPGNIVRISKHKRKTELDNKWIKIIYEDKDIIIINKSCGILSMAAKPGQFCVKTILDEYFTHRHFKCHAHVVHRLDKDTSGLMVYAKSIEAAEILQQDWKGRVFDRRYIAVLCGKITSEGGTIKSWLKDSKAYITFSSPTDNGGKYAVTHYHTLQTKENISLVEMRLETGRKNQIRVHMANEGFPVAGDVKYGNGYDPLHRLCLHAYRLYLYHPMTGERMEFETPFPTQFVNLFKNI